MTRQVAIVIPSYNEGENLHRLLQRLSDLSVEEHISVCPIVVDDGSTDDTNKVAQAWFPNGVRTLTLSRNFGKEAAITAGMLAARDFDAVVVMDGDLQHPPELIPRMLDMWLGGAKVVEAVKIHRGNEPLAKRILVRAYYLIFRHLTHMHIEGATDFKLLDKELVNTYCDLPEKSRFFRGIVQWLGFKAETISFDVPHEEAKSSWSMQALIKYAFLSITSFTATPLQIVTVLGAATFLISVVFGMKALLDSALGVAVDGFTTVIILLLFIGSIQMFSLGVIGIYIGRIYEETKRRPTFMINRELTNLETFE